MSYCSVRRIPALTIFTEVVALFITKSNSWRSFEAFLDLLSGCEYAVSVSERSGRLSCFNIEAGREMCGVLKAVVVETQGRSEPHCGVDSFGASISPNGNLCSDIPGT